jgi:hypothetical protein
MCVAAVDFDWILFEEVGSVSVRRKHQRVERSLWASPLIEQIERINADTWL